MLFEPDWKNFAETYWLIGPITIENRCGVPVSLDGYLEASHSAGPLRYYVEGTQFTYWADAMRATHQASAPQLMLPIQVGARQTLRGIAIVRFPTSELGGFGKYHESDQKLTFVLTLTGTDLHWIVPLRFPYQWNSTPPEQFRLP